MRAGMWRRVLAAAALAILAAAPAAAQSTAPAPRFGIADNSFLVEEAFNQERGIFQNIFLFTRSKDGPFDASFTQEWPFTTQRHQVSYTIPASVVSGQGLFGDVLLNYRLQATTEEGHPAFSPRVSVILPTSNGRRPLGSRGVGWQVNLPFSQQAGGAYFHWNAGVTWQRAAVSEQWQRSTTLAGSVIVALRPMVHLMLESVLAFEPGDDPDTDRARTVTIVPGLRTGWNLGEKQIVLGGGLQVTRGDERDVAALVYFSYELPFLSRR